jgi:hypothetical protein
MLYEALITLAIELALEELEENNMIKTDFVKVEEKECIVCFDKYFTNNLKLLSCNKHFTCKECWDNYAKSRVNFDNESNICFICFKRDKFLNVEDDNNIFEQYDDNDEPILDENIINRLHSHEFLFSFKYLINNINYHNLSITLYQADFTHLITNEEDILINLINNRYMYHKYGLAKTLYDKAKFGFGSESLDWVRENGSVPRNSVVVTNGGRIKAKIIHCNSPNPAGKSISQFKNYLDLCYINIFEKILTMNHIKRIFIPGILARRVEHDDDISIKIAVKSLFDILSIYIFDFREQGINEINIIDYGKNPKILGYLSGYMNDVLFI